MNRRLGLLWSTGLVLGLLWGCASAPKTAAPTASAYWAGRLVIHIQEPQSQALSMDFELTGDAAQGELSLLNPWGTTLALARWTPTMAQLQQGQRSQTFPHMPALLQAVTGAALPLDAVLDWLQGRPSNAPGWEVDLSQRAQGRIVAQRLEPLPAVQLRLMLEQP